MQCQCQCQGWWIVSHSDAHAIYTRHLTQDGAKLPILTLNPNPLAYVFHLHSPHPSPSPDALCYLGHHIETVSCHQQPLRSLRAV